MSKLIIALYVVITSLGLIVLKLGTNSGSPVSFTNHKLALNINPYIISGILLYGVSFVLYIYLISRYDLGYIIPLAAAFVYILIFVASYFVFHEVFTPLKIMAIAFIVLGLVLLNSGK